MRRVIVTGSRQWVDRLSVWTALNQELEIFGAMTLVHGGAAGADDIADRWAWGAHQAGRDIHVEVHRPDYVKYDKKTAPLIRNREMAELGADVCYAFPLEGGTGTRHMMTQAMLFGINVINYGYGPYTIEAREYAKGILRDAAI